MRTLPVTAIGDPDTRSAARFLRWLGLEHTGLIVAGTLWGCLWMLGMAGSPFAIGRAVDRLIAKDTAGLLTWAGAIFVLALGVAAGSIMRHRTDTMIRLGANLRTIQLVTRQATRLGARLDREVAGGEVVAIGTTDIQQTGSLIESFARGISSAITIVAVAVLMLITSLPVGLLVLIGVPLLLFGSGPLLRPLHARVEARRDHQADLTERAVDIVAGLRVLRGIGGEREFGARYRRDSEKVRDSGVSVARIESMLNAAEVLLPGLLALGVVWLGAQLAIDGTLTPGQLVTFYAYAAFLGLPMRIVTEMINDAVSAHVAAGRVVRFLNIPATEDRQAEPATERGVLADPQSGLVLTPGKLTVVATTDPGDAAQLADRLGGYSPAGATPAGATLDGVVLEALPLGYLRKQILLSDNESRLFSGVLADEIGDSDHGRTAEVLHVACAEDIVEALPAGLQSTITERGFSVSGGERQRLKLARAILAEPPILILVDPTSSVDSHTESFIAERLRQGRSGLTTVVISNSPLLLNRADEVAFVSDGKLVVTGTHRELVENTPQYARVVLREAS